MGQDRIEIEWQGRVLRDSGDLDAYMVGQTIHSSTNLDGSPHRILCNMPSVWSRNLIRADPERLESVGVARTTAF